MNFSRRRISVVGNLSSGPHLQDAVWDRADDGGNHAGDGEHDSGRAEFECLVKCVQLEQRTSFDEN